MSSDHDAGEKLFDFADANPQVDTLAAALDRLSTTESGLGFIYSALALLVERFDLVDAVIVLEGPNAGTQIFRFAGKAVSKNFAAQLGVVPGVYCEPRVVVADDLELVRAACQRELSLHQSRLLAAHDTRPVGDGVDDKTTPYVVARSVEHAEPLSVVAQEAVSEILTRSRRRSARARISVLLVVVDVVALTLSVANVDGPVRFFVGLLLGLVIPGWSVVGLIKLENTALEIGLTMAASLAYMVLAAQILISAGLWHPIAFEEITCIVCLPSLLRQSRIQRRRVRSAT